MNRLLQPIFAFALLLLTSATLFAQTTYYYNGTGAITSTASWGQNTDGTGIPPSNFTTDNQVFELRNSLTPTLTGAWTVSGTGSKIRVGDGVAAVVFSTGTFTVTGVVDVADGSTLNVGSNSTGLVIGTLATGAGSSTVIYSGDITQTVREGAYHNLTLTGATAARTKTASGNISVNATLTVDLNNTLAMTTFSLSGPFNTAGSGILTTTAPTGALPNGNTYTFTVNYSGTTQEIAGGNYNILLIAAGTKTAVGNIDVLTTLTTTGALDMGTNALSGTFTQTGTGTLTTAGIMPAGKTWTSATVFYNSSLSQNVAPGTYVGLNLTGGHRTITGTLTVSGALTTGSGTFTTTGSTLELSGATTQTITITGQTSLALNNLSITNGTIKTFSNAIADITINGNLNIPAGRTLAMGNNRLDVIGGALSLLGAGTLNTTCVLSDPINPNLVWPYSVGFNATAADQLPAGTYQNLSITGGGTTTAQGNIHVVNNFTYTGAINMGNNQLTGIAGTIAGTSTLTTLYTGVGDAIPAGKSWVGTVAYAAAGSQNIVDAVSYNSLTISGGGSNVKTATGDLTINATLSVAATTILDMATFRIVSATTYTNTGITRTQNISATPIPSMPAPIVGTVEYNAIGNQTVVANTHTNLNISGGGSRTLTGTINVTGAFTASSGTLVGGASNFNLTGGNQTITLGAGGSFNDFSVLGTGTKTIAIGSGDLVVNGDLTIDAILAMTDNQLDGILTAATGTGTLTTTHTATALPIPASSVWGFTVSFTAAGTGQVVPEGVYSNLNILTNTSTKTAGGDITVNNNLTVNGNASTILDMSTYRITAIGGTISGNGTIRTQNISATPLPAAKSWTPTIVYNSASAQTVVHGDFVALNIAGGDRTISSLGVFNITGAFTANTDPAVYTTTGSTINFTGNAQTLTFLAANPFPFEDVSFTTSSPTVVTKTIAGGGFDVNGTLNVGAEVILNMATLPLGGTPTTINGSGKLITTNTTAAIPSGLTWPFTVIYSANGGTQAIISGTYNNLTITHNSTVNRNRTVSGGDITVNNELILETQNTGNLTLVMGNNRLIGSGTFVFDGINSGGGELAITTTYTDPLLPALPTGSNWSDATISYLANSAGNTQLIANGVYEIITTSGASPKTATGAITINSGPSTFGGTGTITFTDLTINTNGEFLALANSTIIISGTITNSGSFDVGTNVNTVRYTGVNPTVVAPNGNVFGYHNLIIDGTGTATFTGSECVIRGNIEFNQAVTFGTTEIRFSGNQSIQSITGTNLPSNLTTLVTIDKSVGNLVQINGNTEFSGGINIVTGILDAQSHNLILSGSIASASNGSIRFVGTNNLTINGSGTGSLFFDQTTAGTTNRIRDLNMNRTTATITLENSLIISSNGVVTISNGTLNANNNLRLLSTANNQSAQIGTISGTGNITGNVTVERFISSAAGRKWRFIASPVNTTNFISNNWQQQMYIAGNGTGGDCATDVPNSNGFDRTNTNSPSMFTWNTSLQNWSSIPNTTSTNLTTGTGYRVFIRGSRALGCVSLTNSSTPADDLTLAATGTLAIGSQILSCATGASEWTLLANPYQAKVDLEDLSLTNVNDIIYVFNPAQGATGAYNEYDISTSTPSGAMSRYLSPGQAFFIQTTVAAPASVGFTETSKSVNETAGALFKNKITDHILKLNLLSATGEFLNSASAYIHPQATWGFDAIDGPKLSFGTNQIATFNRYSTERLAVNRFSSMPPLGIDTIFVDVNVGSASSGLWQLEITGANTFASHYQVHLYDAFTHTNQDLRLNPNYTYAINNNALSRQSGRIMIIIQNTSTTLPVQLTSFTANANSEHQAILNWETASEINTSHFEIERSSDGTSFKTLLAVKANGKAGKLTTYTQLDKSPYAVGYYRLKMVDKDGSYAHSAIRMVRFDNADIAASLKMYPVPASKSLTIELGETMSSIRIHNAMGKQVYTSKVDVDQVVVPVETLAAGVYTIEIMTISGSRVVERFVKE